MPVEDQAMEGEKTQLQLDHARYVAAWLALWDVVEGDRAAAGGVQICVPIGCGPTVDTLSRELAKERTKDRVFSRDTALDVTWIGFSPENGLVYGSQRWDPKALSQPPVPTVWIEATLDQDAMILGYGSWDRGNPQFSRLPMPPELALGGADRHLEDALTAARKKPLGRMAAGIGVPHRVLNLIHGQAIPDMDKPSVPSHVPYNADGLHMLAWLAGSHSTSGLPADVVRERRVQAVLSMPCFTPDIRMLDITRTVDRGEPLIDALARMHSTSPTTIRIMGAESATMDGTRVGQITRSVQCCSLPTLLDGMPRDSMRTLLRDLPSNGWRRLSSIILEFRDSPRIPFVLTSMAEKLRPGPDGSWNWLVEAEGNRWGHVRDLAQQLSRDLLWPAEAAFNPRAQDASGRDGESGAGRALAVAALGSLGAYRLAKVLDDHMAGALRRAAEVSVSRSNEIIEWPVPAEPIVAPSGQVLRFLSTSWELAQEGQKMGHCVGDYTDACVSKRCAVMSMGQWQDGEWSPTSTVEIRRGGDGNGAISVVQHYGAGNTAPPATDVEALAHWTAGLRTGETVFDERTVMPFRELNHISRVLGQDWQTPEAAEARWDHWRRILGARHNTAGEFLQHVVSETGLDQGWYEKQAGVLNLVRQVTAWDAAMASPEARDAFDVASRMPLRGAA